MKGLLGPLLLLGLSVLAAACDVERGLPGQPSPDSRAPLPPPPPPRMADAGAPDASSAAVRCSSTEDVVRHILGPKCNTCHSGGPVGDYPDLQSPPVRQRVLEARSRDCHDRPLVMIASDGGLGGHFFDKLAGAVPGCGSQMPFGSIPPLTDAEVACVRRWLGPAWQE